jgi:hypothetical protein
VKGDRCRGNCDGGGRRGAAKRREFVVTLCLATAAVRPAHRLLPHAPALLSSPACSACTCCLRGRKSSGTAMSDRDKLLRVDPPPPPPPPGLPPLLLLLPLWVVLVGVWVGVGPVLREACPLLLLVVRGSLLLVWPPAAAAAAAAAAVSVPASLLLLLGPAFSLPLAGPAAGLLLQESPVPAASPSCTAAGGGASP